MSKRFFKPALSWSAQVEFWKLPEYSIIHNNPRIHSKVGNQTSLRGVCSSAASSNVNAKFKEKLDWQPYIVAQSDDTVLNVETLEVRKRIPEDACSMQCPSR